ncbi:MAG: hypothetical protein MJ244_05760 [Clostridia bacterium]|nr:hypothetical protein [Clostridia bacterium]
MAKMSKSRKAEMRKELCEKAQKAAKKVFAWLAKAMGILTLAVIVGKLWMHAHASWLSILGSAILTAIFAVFAILDFKDIFDWIAEKWEMLIFWIKGEDDDEESESEEPEPKAKAKEIRSESESEEDDDEDVSKPAPKPVEKKPAPKPAPKPAEVKKPISIEEAFDLELDGLTF